MAYINRGTVSSDGSGSAHHANEAANSTKRRRTWVSAVTARMTSDLLKWSQCGPGLKKSQVLQDQFHKLTRLGCSHCMKVILLIIFLMVSFSEGLNEAPEAYGSYLVHLVISGYCLLACCSWFGLQNQRILQDLWMIMFHRSPSYPKQRWWKQWKRAVLFTKASP